MIKFYEIELLEEYTTPKGKFYKKGARLLVWEDIADKCYWIAPCFQTVKETYIPSELVNKVYEIKLTIEHIEDFNPIKVYQENE